MQKLIKVLLVICFPGISFSGLAQQQITFFSDNANNQIIEVYSSQGCSSCPPAEKWVSSLLDSPSLWHSIFPMVFHVDYWNYLGWRDPYSSPAYSARQQQLKRQNILKAVYTPGFVVNGSEWRGWFRGAKLPPASSSKGELTVTLTKTHLEATFNHNLSNPNLNMAILGFDIHTPVLAGENQNRTLRQDFVVLSHQKFPAMTTDKPLSWRESWEKPQLAAPRYAVVFWLDKAENLRPMNVTGGWLPRPFVYHQ